MSKTPSTSATRFLMHGDFDLSTKALARQIRAKSVQPCKPEIAEKHSGFLVGLDPKDLEAVLKVARVAVGLA